MTRRLGLEPIDLGHLGSERTIGVYPLETDDGLALFDCGPSVCVETLEEGLDARGLALVEVRHLLLSHIHLDHAGAVGSLVARLPHLQVHVSAVGAPHLVHPERLERSARRLYGDAFDSLWGALVPVPEENVRPVSGRVLGLDCFPTPGHASHHVSYLDDAGTLYSGDAAGVRIQPHQGVLPPTPPPEFDLDAWLVTLDEIEGRRPERLALVHFGVAEDVERHLAELRERLRGWARLIEDGASEDEFVRAARAGFEPDEAEAYDRAMPFWQSYAGLERWRDRRREATSSR